MYKQKQAAQVIMIKNNKNKVRALISFIVIIALCLWGSFRLNSLIQIAYYDKELPSVKVIS
jgi:hypothetical protein